MDMTGSRSHKRMGLPKSESDGESAERDGSDTGMPSDPPKTPIVCRGRASIEQSRKSVFRMDGQLLELLGAAYEWTGMAK